MTRRHKGNSPSSLALDKSCPQLYNLRQTPSPAHPIHPTTRQLRSTPGTISLGARCEIRSLSPVQLISRTPPPIRPRPQPCVTITRFRPYTDTLPSVWLGGNLEEPEGNGEDIPEEYQQNGQGVAGRSSFDTGCLPAGGGRIAARPGEIREETGAFAIRLASATDGPHAVVIHGRTGLGKRLRGTLGQATTARVERSVISQGRVFPGSIEIPPALRGEEKGSRMEAATRKARRQGHDPGTVWTAG